MGEQTALSGPDLVADGHPDDELSQGQCAGLPKHPCGL